MLWSIIQISGNFAALYIVKCTKLEEKYPKYKKWIHYFININIIYIVIDNNSYSINCNYRHMYKCFIFYNINYKVHNTLLLTHN